MSKLHLKASQVTQKFFDKGDFLGIEMGKPSKDVLMTLVDFHSARQDGFITVDLTEEKAYETARIAMRIRLHNVVIDALLRRRNRVETGKYIVGDKMTISNTTVSPDVEVRNSVHLQVQNNPQYHNGGYMWIDEDEYVHVGFI